MTLNSIRAAILSGEVVIVPTETVYGLLCLESSKNLLCKIKSRPETMPLAYVYHCKSLAIKDAPEVKEIIDKLLPGPYTIIVNNQLGIRVSNHKLLCELIKPIEQKLVLTSANLHGKSPAINFSQASKAFPDLRGIDGGVCYYRRPSTLIRVEFRQ